MKDEGAWVEKGDRHAFMCPSYGFRELLQLQKTVYWGPRKNNPFILRYQEVENCDCYLQSQIVEAYDYDFMGLDNR